MSKIPFSDYFEVEMRYVFSRDGNNYCHIQVGLVVNFLKATWFKSQINSSARSESKEALESWMKQSIEFLESQRNRIVSLSPTLGALSTSESFSELESETGTTFRPVLKHQAPGAPPTAKLLKSANAPATASKASCTADTSAIRHFLSPPSLVQLLLLGALCYGCLLLRGNLMQMQQLTDVTTKLLDQLQSSRV
ncbi:unnamed protein product [Peronospora effusa]|nr:unnamed protein product [Peronospora effusa]